jgi:membrane-bound ClpP family serine protease
MRIGGSLFLIAVGAILKFAITTQVSGVDLGVIGIILMIVGFVGLVITVVWMATRHRTEVIEHGPGGTRGTTYYTPRNPYDEPR